jgi:hypothetical protein
MLAGARTEELHRIDEAREEARADSKKLEAKIDAVKDSFAGIDAKLARIEVLMEEPKAQTMTMLDGITPSFIDLVSERRIEESAAFRDYLGELLKGAGTGVFQITVDPPRESSSDVYVEMQEVVEAALRGLPRDSRVKLHHASRDGALVPFSVDEESDGTRHLMALAPFLFDLLQPVNGAPIVHVIDELDKSLHPLLTRFFLDAFLRASSAEHPGQILFTTHDTNLLDLNVLSRDSIWFTEKDAAGATSLYSLAEFKGEQLDRIGEHLEAGYLQGRFGAIPFLGVTVPSVAITKIRVSRPSPDAPR